MAKGKKQKDLKLGPEMSPAEFKASRAKTRARRSKASQSSSSKSPAKRPASTTEQVGQVNRQAKAKADTGTKMPSKPTAGRQFKSQDERADEFSFPGKHKDVSKRIFKKKK